MGEIRRTLAEDLRQEEEQLHRRFVHHTRPRGPLSWEQAMELSRRMRNDMDGPASDETT